MADQQTKAKSRNAVLDSLNEAFEVFRAHKPLALGIHKEIAARRPEIPASDLRLAMRIHTQSTRYLKELLTATVRFDLDGQPSGEVTEEHHKAADEALKERFKKVAERKKAERKAQADAERERKAAEQRQDKLNQLAARFNNR
jgi:ProP effector